MTKTILITGSTDGIGKLTAQKLAAAGHRVYVHGRNQAKLDAVIAEIKTETGNQQVSGFMADFSDLAQVRAMGKEVAQTLDSLDVLVNNAGILKVADPRTEAGLDLRIVVNYLAAVVLSQELISKLESSSDGRLINLSSAAQSPVSLPALAGQEALSDFEAYAQSKLALTMWSFALASQHPALTITAVNPGSMLNTNMVKDAFGGSGKSADEGADVLYRLVADEKLQGLTGQYFDNDRGDFGPAHPAAYDADAVEALLQATQKLIAV